MRKYSVKEVFLTIQGEGLYAGSTAVFVRFSGCNLWSGLEKDRYSATCKFCDTDFVGIDGTLGGRYSADVLADIANDLWPENRHNRFAVMTGGEPALQWDSDLYWAFRGKGFRVAMETNGTLPVKGDVDWLTVSPKAGTHLVKSAGNELKVVYPQPGLDMDALGKLAFPNRFVQPMDGPESKTNTDAAVAFVLANPGWRLSVQAHKFVGVR
jgi:7-carboxy-7-deazaguanine synthase